MTAMAEDVSPALLVWAARRTVDMHGMEPSEDRPWAGRCAACGPDGCGQLAWALDFLRRLPVPLCSRLAARYLSGDLEEVGITYGSR